ncbi:MAG: GNAT family N-acetyltransferase [Gemmatimonadaceae bacterium]
MGEIAGFFELVRNGDGSVEIAYSGLPAAFHRRGLGKWLLTHAVDRAWATGANRVWLHTCTLDDPAALPNYRARGFIPYRTEHYGETRPD